jgi:hypothetical protein
MKKLFAFFIFLLIIIGCKEKFIPSLQSPVTGYLVVEGYISSGAEPTTITLTHTTKLYDTSKIIYEHNAQVNIVGQNQETYPLFETGNGVYTSASLNLNSSEKYHLQIKTRDGKEYASDDANVKQTPEIDSLTWARENGGLKVYVNTHDPQNNTRYYHWKYEETWEFHATYFSSLVYTYDQNNQPIGVAFRKPDQSADTTIYKCWNNLNSTNINLGSSEKLAQDIIDLPIIFIKQGSVKLSVLYSLNVRQYALSRDAYLFFQKIKKNTEEVGSIFDAQPSELQGNIHCISNPAEVVIGYVDISQEKVRRVFINNSDLPGWNYTMACAQTIIDNQPDSIHKYGISLNPTVVYTSGIGGSVKQFYATPEINCMNCTLSGSNKRPSFWP